MSWDFDRFSSGIQPGERVVSSRLLASIRINDEDYSRASRHPWTSLRITYCCAIFILLMNNPHEIPEITIMLHD